MTDTTLIGQTAAAAMEWASQHEDDLKIEAVLVIMATEIPNGEGGKANGMMTFCSDQRQWIQRAMLRETTEWMT